MTTVCKFEAFCQPEIIGTVVNAMNAPIQQPGPQETVASHLSIATDDFDHWAKNVRKQMLNCLQKRSGRWRFATMRSPK